MLCPRCGTSMNQCREDYRYQESGLGNIWLVGCEVWKCDACRNAFAVLPDARLAAREIARILILQPYRLDSRSIHFCRKLLGMTALQLGIRLGVHRVEVSRWENDRANIDPFNDFKLRLTLVDHIFSSCPPRVRDEVTLQTVAMMRREYNPVADVSTESITVAWNQIAQDDMQLRVM